MTLEEKKAKVLAIPMQSYFSEIIVPNMSSYYDGDYPVDFEASRYVKCCFHDEDTPSMRYYEDTNTLYCFGCSTFANTIILHKKFVDKMNGVQIDDNEAIDFLYKYFIQGTDSAKLSETKYQSFKNTPEQIARYNVYRKDIEKSVNADKTISEENKRKLWSVIDNTDRFLEKDKIEAEQAIKAIKETVEMILKC